jgi:hypothetical protein
MNPIEILRKTNTVLIFVLLVAALLLGGYLVIRSRQPINTIHVSVDSVRLHKK